MLPLKCSCARRTLFRHFDLFVLPHSSEQKLCFFQYWLNCQFWLHQDILNRTMWHGVNKLHSMCDCQEQYRAHHRLAGLETQSSMNITQPLWMSGLCCIYPCGNSSQCTEHRIKVLQLHPTSLLPHHMKPRFTRKPCRWLELRRMMCASTTLASNKIMTLTTSSRSVQSYNLKWSGGRSH